MLCSKCHAAPALLQSPAHRCEACAERVWAESVKWVVNIKAREAAKRPRIIYEPSAPDLPACVRVLFGDGRAYLCHQGVQEVEDVRVTFDGHDLDPATDPHSLYFAAHAQEIAAALESIEQARKRAEDMHGSAEPARVAWFAARFVLDHGTKEERPYLIVESKSRRTWVLSSATPLARAYRFRTMREALEVLRELCADSRHLTSTRDRFDVLNQDGALVWTSGDQPMQPASPAPSEIITEPARTQSRDATLALTIAPLGLREPSPQHGEAGGDLVQLRIDHTPAPHTTATLSRLEKCQGMRYLWDIYSESPIKIERHPPDIERHRLGIASAAILSGLRVGGLGMRLDSRSNIDAILIPPRANPRRLWVVFHFGAANPSTLDDAPHAQERWEVYEITSERALWLCVAEEPSP